MKLNIKRIASLTCLSVFSVSLVTFAAPIAKTIQAYLKPDIKVIVDGKTTTFKDVKGTTVYPIIYNGTTYLPVRSVSELMGKPAVWEAKTQTIYIGESGIYGKSLLSLTEEGQGASATKVTSKEELTFPTPDGKETRSYTEALKISNVTTYPRLYTMNLDKTYSSLSGTLYYKGSSKATIQIRNKDTNETILTRILDPEKLTTFEGLNITKVKALQINIFTQSEDNGTFYIIEPKLN